MSKRVKVKLDDFIDEIMSENEHFIIGSYTDESGVLRNINLLTDDLFKDYSDSFFYDRTLPVKIGDEEDLEDGVIRVFEEHWESFLADNEHNFDRIAEALYTYYNPLWNYNKNQHTINIRTGSETLENETNYGATQVDNTKTGRDLMTNQYGATTDTLTKAGTEEIEREYGATTDTLNKTGSEQVTNQHGATEKHTTESGAFTDTHNIGAKETISSATTYDSGTFLDTGKVNEAARVDSDTRTYNNHDVEETEAIHTDTEERSFNNYRETTTGALHTDTETRSFTGYQETSSGAARTDTATRSFDNYKETTSGAAHVDSGEETKTYNNVKDEFTDDTHGNIGVMESVTMIESELRLRSRQIGLDLLTKFYDTFTYRV